jgi:antitoxin HicB
VRHCLMNRVNDSEHLAACSEIAYDCGNSAVLPACREFSEHICSPNVRAEDALESALAMYVAAKEPLPTSSEAEADEVTVPLSALGMAKAALYEGMREQGVGRAELARRLRWHLPQVNRVLDLRHASRMEHVEAALAALGLRLIVDVARAA